MDQKLNCTEKFPTELWERLASTIEEADVLCQLAMVSKTLYKAVQLDFKKLCRSNLIYHLPGEMWAEALSELNTRVWQPEHLPNQPIFCKESGKVAFAIEETVYVINLDFERPSCQTAREMGNVISMVLHNGGNSLAMEVVLAERHVVEVDLTTSPVQRKQIPWKIFKTVDNGFRKHLDFVCYSENEEAIYDPALQMAVSAASFPINDDFAVIVFPDYPGKTHRYLGAYSNQEGSFCILDTVTEEEFLVHYAEDDDAEAQSVKVIAPIDAVAVVHMKMIRFINFRTNEVLLTVPVERPEDVCHINRSLLATSSGKLILLNDDSKTLFLYPKTLNELLVRNGDSFQWNWHLSLPFEELMFVDEVNPRTQASEHYPVLILVQNEKLRLLWYPHGKCPGTHLFRKIYDRLEASKPQLFRRTMQPNYLEAIRLVVWRERCRNVKM